MKKVYKYVAIISLLFIVINCDTNEYIEEEEEEVITQNSNSIIPNSTNGRQNVSQGCVETTSREITVSIWDNERIDGDIVSIYVNDNLVLSEYSLLGPSDKKTINVLLDYNGYNYITLYAHNTYTIPPANDVNSASISINGRTFNLNSKLTYNGSYNVISLSGTDNTLSCSSNPPQSSNGKIAFYTKSDYGCGNVSITVDSQTSKTLNQYFQNGISDCSQGAVFDLSIGTHSYTATCGGISWSDSFEITADGCLRYELQNSGGSTSNTGTIAFFTKEDKGCGNISITVDGTTTKTLSQYFVDGISDCTKGAIFNLSAGSHTYAASCGNYSWNGSFDITADGCLKFQLN